MKPYARNNRAAVYHGDCLETMRRMPDASVDAVVTDPPYGLSKAPDMAEVLRHWLDGDDYTHRGAGFMGKSWDSFVPGPAIWREAFRILKPGGHMLVFAGSRTQDLMGLSIRLAGFDIRDSIAWLYGSGFPKSLDVSKAIDKAAGAEREVVGLKTYGEGAQYGEQPSGGRSAGIAGQVVGRPPSLETAPATEDAQRWQGWGTALKPAHEPIIVARKPIQGTVAANVLQHGTGALNIDGCRVGDEVITQHGRGDSENTSMSGRNYAEPAGRSWAGRWPANVALDETQAAALDEQSGKLTSGKMKAGTARANLTGWTGPMPEQTGGETIGDTGGASRFYYTAKAPKRERPTVDGVSHPTVKPLALMRWLVRLVTPPDGLVLDPFAGSGATLEAAHLEGFRAVGIELTDEYLPLIAARLERLVDGQETA